MLIRSMAPQVVAADEIGTIEDVEAIEEAVCCRSKRHIYSTWRKQRRTNQKPNAKGTHK